MEPQGSPLELPHIIEESIGRVGRKLGHRDVSMVAEYPAHLPAVSADPTELVGAITCLITQAGEFVDTGEIKIRAEVLSVGESPEAWPVVAGSTNGLSQGGPWALLRVSFSVPGPSRAQLRALLEEDGWSKEDCAEALKAFSDRLWVECADDDAECRFCLALSLWAAYEVTADVTSLRRAVESRLSERGGPEPTDILLLVEDEELRALLGRDLDAAGYDVVLADSGEDVLSLARAEQPDLVLLDLLARAPTAFEVAGLLKHDRKTRNIPVLFLTSIDDPTGGLSMGAVSFLARQPDTGALISAVNAVLTSSLQPNSRVLVVELDDRLRERMVMTIQSQGYRVSEARSPEEALALAERATPGLAIVNAQLAQDGDYWLLRGLRQTAPEAEIYVMADVLSQEEVRAAMRRGASGYSETGKLPDLLDRMRNKRLRDL